MRGLVGVVGIVGVVVGGVVTAGIGVGLVGDDERAACPVPPTAPLGAAGHRDCRQSFVASGPSASL